MSSNALLKGERWFDFVFVHGRSELSDHLESIDYGLENLQHILNAQSINFDGSPLFDVNISMHF